MSNYPVYLKNNAKWQQRLVSSSSSNKIKAVTFAPSPSFVSKKLNVNR